MNAFITKWNCLLTRAAMPMCAVWRRHVAGKQAVGGGRLKS